MVAEEALNRRKSIQQFVKDHPVIKGIRISKRLAILKHADENLAKEQKKIDKQLDDLVTTVRDVISEAEGEEEVTWYEVKGALCYDES